MNDNICVACHHCDLLLELVHPEAGDKASCPRCGYTLTANHPHAIDRVMAFSVTALIFLFLANCFPFLSVTVQGQEQTITLMESMSVLVSQDFISLAVLIFIPVILIPTLYLLSALYICLSIRRERLLPDTKRLMKLMVHLQQWNMAEIFLIGILVSFIKILSLADVEMGLSFWAYVMFILSMTMAMVNIDRYQFWRWIRDREDMPVMSLTATENINRCHMCESIVDASREICGCCGSRVHKRYKDSIQKTWALLITAMLLYVPANLLPIMKMEYLGVESSNTIIGGVLVLWQHGSYPIALIIFVASVLIPIGKIISLSWLCYSVQRGENQFCQQKTTLYRRTELVGRWSMIDVFVVVILVALIRMGSVMSVYPGWGAVAFGALVIVTILAAMSFDPRLIWDRGACAR